MKRNPVAGLEGRIVRESSAETIFDGPKAMQTSQLRLAAKADTLLIGALMGVDDAEAVAEFGITDAGGRAQYGATYEAVLQLVAV